MGKKKGAANKLARMSDEERARYLQHRADIEEEARRRKQQLIAIFMKNKLKREEAFSRLNMAKINQEWRTILRNIKCAELRTEVKSLQKYFEDAFQRKNQTIDRLLFELDESEEMYATMLHSHLKAIDKLIVMHAERLSFWTVAYENEKKLLLQQYNDEMDSYKERKFRAHKELECVHYGLETLADERQKLAGEKQEEKVYEIKSKMLLRLETMTKQREDKMNRLWQMLQSILREYSARTEEKYGEYVELRERDNADTKQIRQNYMEIARVTGEIGQLKATLEAGNFEHKIHMDQLGDYKKLLRAKQTALKQNMDAGQKVDKERMLQLVVCSTQANAKLDKLVAKGKNILQLSAICAKLETEREKVLPFTRPVRMLDKRLPIDIDFKQITLSVMSKTEYFWIRFNNAEIDCACLEEERAELRKENARLTDKLRDYLTNVALSNGRIGSTKERLRPSSMKIEKVVHIDLMPSANGKPRRRRPVTCIEGNLSVAVRSQKLVQNKPKIPSFFPLN